MNAGEMKGIAMKQPIYTKEDAEAAFALIDEPEAVHAPEGFTRRLDARLDLLSKKPAWWGEYIPAPAFGIAFALLLLLNILSVAAFLQPVSTPVHGRAKTLAEFSTEYAIENYSGFNAGEQR